jgi:hypothetical protein
MHSASTTVGPRWNRRARLALGACVALLVQACSGGGGGGDPGPVDHARLDACVLVGAAVADGCTTTGANEPVLQLGDVAMGETKGRVLALYNGGDGDVAAIVSAVELSPSSDPNYTLSLFQVQGGVESAAALPFELLPGHGSELRVRVGFTANAAIGPASGVLVDVTATHPATARQVPVTANVTGCPAGLGDCDEDPSNACETDIQSALAHCGGCGAACSDANGAPSCTEGVCSIACDPGFESCDGGVGNGCESELASDPLHCGGCGIACDGTHGTPTCSAGTCGITCDAGFSDCDGDPSNGCEVDLDSDAAHCGGCGIACDGTNGTPTCSAGTCGITCAAGYADCDGDAANGCEVNVDGDTANCGACATACSTTNATPSCTAGVCAVACSAGFADCDGDAATGCESELANDPLHCGACVVACSTANGAASCTAGVCGITCNPGFDDCDGTAASGCEVDLQADPAHCGSCANACGAANGTPSCTAGACGISCDTGFQDCDANAATGCEVNVQADPANCSACGTTCDATNATAFCDAAACGVTCDVGYGDCDAQAATGCESDLGMDAANCGGCGASCPAPPNATAGCTGGSCDIGACDDGFADCDTLVEGGCEVDLTSDLGNCGACGLACTPTANVAASDCVSAGCTATACAGGWIDYDLGYSNGCECKTPLLSGSCAAPFGVGNINTGASYLGPVDGIPGGREAYYSVTFPPVGLRGIGEPRIRFARNDGGLAVFDVLTTCGGSAYGCGTGGTGGVATGVTDYWFTDNASIGYTTRTVAWPTTVFVRVRQKPATAGCPTYQLLFSR